MIDVVATDHAPHAVEDKECEWAYARPGMLGLETALSIVLDVLGPRWDLIAERMSRTPARIAGLAEHGHDPAPGAPANLTLVDPAARWTVDPAELASRSRNTPYAGHDAARPDRGDVPARRADGARRKGREVRRAPAILVLEDGRTFRGEAYGSVGETFGEAVFNTGMTGYQETLTDPSYHRQVVVQTAPHIGNTGVNGEDDESGRIWVAGYVVRDPARIGSNWRATGELEDRLAAEGVVGISGVDTRALTRHLRERGAMRVGVSSVDDRPAGAAGAGAGQSPQMVGADLSAEVTTPQPYTVDAEGEHRFTVAALDLGIKRNVPRRLAARGVTTHVLPATSTLDDLLAAGADAVFFSPGPGDPATADHAGRAGPGGDAAADPAVRHLLRQPDPRPGAGLRHLQARVRPPRHQPAGARPDHRQGRGHLAQPRLRGRRAARRAWSTPTSARSRSATCA